MGLLRSEEDLANALFYLDQKHEKEILKKVGEISWLITERDRNFYWDEFGYGKEINGKKRFRTPEQCKYNHQSLIDHLEKSKSLI